jgi:phage regulator Rha-like protein
MLDSELAGLYGVELRALIQAVKRNLRRFPDDFMFQLTLEEYRSLRSQIVILNNRGRGRHRKYIPYVFTEQGVAMLSGLLHSSRAIETNIAIMRAFVRMREMLAENQVLSEKLKELENKLIAHDYQIEDILTAIRNLMREPKKHKPKIGYLS